MRVRPALSLIIGLSLLAEGFLTQGAVAQTQDTGSIEVLFTYGSEKQKWIEAVTQRFNLAGYTTGGRQVIRVKAVPLGSGEIIDELLTDRRHPHLISPAAGAFIEIGNAAARERNELELVGETQELVSSPVVIAMWRDMAEAIGWPNRRIRWHDFFDYARDPVKWQAVARPEWGAFKYGHTHPRLSNSGLHALFVEAYAAANKFERLTRVDVKDRPEVNRYIRQVESSVVHYGESTGFFAKKMIAMGPSYLSAAILYENLVIDANRVSAAANEPPKLVAIYPAEGTFPSEHPVGVVQRPWVTPRHAEAASIYIKYLLSSPQQVEAKRYGFRPGAKDISVDDLLTPALGVDPHQPKRILRPPQASTIQELLKIWSQNKRKADIVLAIDTSASMKEANKIIDAERAAREFVSMLSPEDTLSTMVFGGSSDWLVQDLLMDEQGKKAATDSISDLIPSGDTALYQTISDAYAFLAKRDPNRTRALVLLSDGKDSKKKLTKGDVLRRIAGVAKDQTIFIFTIGYGKDADPATLSEISRASQAEYFSAAQGDSAAIHKVFVQIATLF